MKKAPGLFSAFSKLACQAEGFSLISKKSLFSYLGEFVRKIDIGNLNTKIHLKQRTIAEYIKQRRTLKLLHLLRNYSAIAVVVSSALLVSATNVASGKGSGLFGYLDENPQIGENLSGKINGQLSRKNDLALVPLSKSSSAIDPTVKDDAESQSFVKNQGIMSATSANPTKDPEEDGGVKMYVVADGDTLGSIAAKNKVSVNTILWANDISNADQIKPGDTLFILPVSGIQYTIKAGDTLDAVAGRFKAEKDKIIAFNDLPANGDVEVGKEIVIPDGQGTSPAPSQSTQNQSPAGVIAPRQYANANGGTPEVSSGTILSKSGKGHSFPYGYCTWYVAQKRYVPWGGNAGTWLYHAKAGGYATGRSPRVGAIVVTTENRYYGHVAYVEKVSGDTITVSEMNYVGFAKKSTRTLSASSRAIKGFIY